MRVTHAASFRLMQTEINQINTNMAKLQEQAATGKRVNQLSDDPTAVRPILNFRTQIGASERYEQNMGSAQVDLQAVEGNMDRAQELLVQLEEHTINAVNGSFTEGDRETVADIVGQLKEEMLGLANTQMNGKYAFAGYAEKTQPFAQQPDGSVDYSGDANRRAIEIAPGEEVEITMDGARLFQGKEDLDGDGTAEAQTGTDLFALFSDVEAAMRDNDGAVVSEQRFSASDTEVNSTGSAQDLQINETTISIADGATLEGVRDEVNSRSAGVTASIEPGSDGTVQLHITPDEAGEPLEISGFNGLDGFTGELSSKLGEIQSGMDQVSNLRGEVGMTINRLESAVDARNEATNDLKQFLSVYEDADIIEVSTNLMQQQTSLKAALAVTSQIGQMTLLDYM